MHHSFIACLMFSIGISQLKAAPVLLLETNLSSTGKSSKPDKKLTKDERKQFTNAMKTGREKHKKGDYAGAVLSFEKALGVKPDDARAMSELGYAAYFAKDYVKAEEFTRRAIKRTSAPDIRGSSLYNLGLIQVAQGKNSDAIVSYTQSLEARPNRVVRDALAQLDPTAAARFDPLNPVLLDGPYATLEDWCKVAKSDSNLIDVKGCNTDSEAIDAWKDAVKSLVITNPYKNVRLLISYAPLFQEEGEPITFTGLGEAVYHLAMQTEKGWYVMHNGQYVYNPGAFGVNQLFTPIKLEVQDALVGGSPELLYSYDYDTSDHDMAGAIFYYANSRNQVICGVGSSGTPSCSTPIITRLVSGVDTSNWVESELGPPPDSTHESEWNVEVGFLPEAKIDVKARSTKGTKSLPKDVKAGLGIRPLNFP